ncbi:MAG: hypothetical protein O2910_03530 [Proteobacteria bacterium]|jgi:cytochrome P450|nr:hypothetical protein [Pseudomonadota bacterium]
MSTDIAGRSEHARPPSPHDDSKVTVGLNGVPIAAKKRSAGVGYRTYEVHQRERVGESTEKIKGRELISPEFTADPYPVFEILRENYPCYRDWLNNAYWITRYNDVTSIFADDANFETRSKLWFYGREGYGRDLRGELPVLIAFEKAVDDNAAPVAEQILGDFVSGNSTNLATEFAARYPLELWARVLDLPSEDFPTFVGRYWRMHRGTNWEPVAEQDGLAAMAELTEYFRPLLEQRRANPGEDMVSAIAALEVDGGPTTAKDVVTTLLESDHETLHGALSNMWFQLLTYRDQLDHVTSERRLVKFSYLETLRHSTPVLTAKRFARHEVERFGKLLPEGALLMCAAAAANRDPRQYDDPDRFIVGRKDLCQREPRGQYRADGLPAGITFGMGPPSKHPALPDDRPRSLYAITRDTAVTASDLLLDMLPNIRIADGTTPTIKSLRLGEMHTCWDLPVTFDRS